MLLLILRLTVRPLRTAHGADGLPSEIDRKISEKYVFFQQQSALGPQRRQARDRPPGEDTEEK
jgi:hypothetical protein